MPWVDGKVVARTEWAEGLVTLRVDAPAIDFAPGQWLNLGLTLHGELVKRSYSIASAPGLPLELYLVVVEGGALSPHLCALDVGDALLVQTDAQGFFTLDHVPDARDLWLLATGTGLGPYISMIRSGRLWSRFERVVLVHGARHVDQLGYRDELEGIAERRAGFTYVPMVSRQDDERALRGRIPANLDNGRLEKAAGLSLRPELSHVLLCGNPDMIRDTTDALAARGLRKHRTRKPGHISTEKYW